MSRPRISVVLTTYNDDSRLRLALGGYARQEFRDFELIVVNDGGNRPGGADRTAELVRSFSSTHMRPQYRFLEPESSEFRLAAARNVGIRAAKGALLVISDGDCVPDPRLLGILAGHFADDRILIGTRKRIHSSVIPHLDLDDLPALENLAYSTDRRLTHPPFARTFLSLKDTAPENSWRLCWGCLFAAPMTHVKAIGGFDERFRDWGREDEDLTERLVRGRGCRFYSIPEAFVFHLDHKPRDEDTGTRQLLEEIRRDWTVVRNSGPMREEGDRVDVL